jgi:hypothetical protein
MLVAGAAASAVAVPVAVHFAVAAVIAGVAALAATRWLVDEAGFGSQPVFVRPTLGLLVIISVLTITLARPGLRHSSTRTDASS